MHFRFPRCNGLAFRPVYSILNEGRRRARRKEGRAGNGAPLSPLPAEPLAVPGGGKAPAAAGPEKRRETAALPRRRPGKRGYNPSGGFPRRCPRCSSCLKAERRIPDEKAGLSFRSLRSIPSAGPRTHFPFPAGDFFLPFVASPHRTRQRAGAAFLLLRRNHRRPGGNGFRDILIPLDPSDERYVEFNPQQLGVSRAMPLSSSMRKTATAACFSTAAGWTLMTARRPPATLYWRTAPSRWTKSPLPEGGAAGYRRQHPPGVRSGEPPAGGGKHVPPLPAVQRGGGHAGNPV